MDHWLVYALLSAVAAALIPIFGKIGMGEMDSSLATAIRSVVMALLCVGFVTIRGLWSKLGQVHGKAMLTIVLTGAAGAASWLFYFRAIQLGKASQVQPIDKLSVPLAAVLAFLILGERPSGANWFGIALIAVGAYLAALPAKG